MNDDERIALRFQQLAPTFNERSMRLFAAAEANALGYGGVSRLSRITGLSRPTIEKGQREIAAGHPLENGRIRVAGGGRKKAEVADPPLLADLECLLEPLTRGDPASPLRWTCKSIRVLAAELRRQGYGISQYVVWSLLHQLKYSLQGNRKTVEGNQHPDRNAQFEHISARVQKEMAEGNPVISVDTKKKELVGNYKNNGRKWHQKGEAPKVNGHDFPDPSVPRAYPYGIYDLGRNQGHVEIGTDHDTAEFAVASIRGWWRREGRKLYPRARVLLVTADSGGSNGYRSGLWKRELQRFANDVGIPVSVCHFPPGTSKWNKVEHRLFSFISSNWRGEPLTDYETIVRLISSTKTAKGLSVSCYLNRRKFKTGIRVSKKELQQLNLRRDDFHGEWNYTILPQTIRQDVNVIL
jgi:transposase